MSQPMTAFESRCSADRLLVLVYGVDREVEWARNGANWPLQQECVSPSRFSYSKHKTTERALPLDLPPADNLLGVLCSWLMLVPVCL